MVWRPRTEIGRRIKHFIRTGETAPPRGTRKAGVYGQKNMESFNNVTEILHNFKRRYIKIWTSDGHEEERVCDLVVFVKSIPFLVVSDFLSNADDGEVIIEFSPPITVWYDSYERTCWLRMRE